MKKLVPFDFCCNDPDNGDFAGKVWMAQYGDAEIETRHGGYFRFTEIEGGIRIHRRKFKVVRYTYWHGNWCWNRYWLPRAEAKRLLATLKANGWRVTCGPSIFYRWFNGRAA